MNVVEKDGAGIVLFTSDELAALLRCRAETLARWRKQGRGPSYVRVAGRVLYARDEVMRWLGEHLHVGEQ